MDRKKIKAFAETSSAGRPACKDDEEGAIKEQVEILSNIPRYGH